MMMMKIRIYEADDDDLMRLMSHFKKVNDEDAALLLCTVD